ncbi:putative glycosyl transferase [Planctomycetes bacterium MalM25]|nr:putative glycosyl transferase [Planctomycetes bacterium MalM25]
MSMLATPPLLPESDAVQPLLTVVLPIHNAERTLRRDVSEVLEAAAELTPRVELLIVDDASTDDSYEAAAELARDYPQVRVVRRARRSDLRETLREVRANIASGVVIVHDGSSRVNADQLRLIWRQQQVLGAVRDAQEGPGGVSFADLRRPSMTQPAMEVAHRRLWGFQRMFGQTAEEAPAAEQEVDGSRRTDGASQPAPAANRGMGGVPNLPTPSVLGSIADFALGE